jgi:hypothetical protein
MACKHRAIIIVTGDVPGTSSSIAKHRVELGCELEAAHDGPHRSDEHDESWEDRGGPLTHIIRHDGE